MHRLLLLLFLLAGCATFTTETTRLQGYEAGRAASVHASKVQVYSSTEAITCPFDRTAMLTAKHMASAPRQSVIERVRPKVVAAGGNALVLTPENDQTVVAHGETSFLVVYEDRPCSMSNR